jgi:hypothetical protein
MRTYTFDFPLEVTDGFDSWETDGRIDGIHCLYTPTYDQFIRLDGIDRSTVDDLLNRVRDIEESLADGEGGVEIMLGIVCTTCSDGTLEFSCDAAEILRNGSHQFGLSKPIRDYVFNQLLVKIQDTPVHDMDEIG